MNILGNVSSFKKPRFHPFDCVVLKRDIEGTTLRRGDVGAIMDVYRSGDGNFYDVDFTERRELENVPENALKLDFRLMQKKVKRFMHQPTFSRRNCQRKDQINQSE